MGLILLFQASVACFGSGSVFCSAHGDYFDFRRLYINKAELNILGNNREQHLLTTEIIKYVYQKYIDILLKLKMVSWNTL